MGNKTKATPEEAREKGPETPDAPLPLLDLSSAAVTKMIQQAAKRGYVTYEQLNAVMPSEEVTSEKIEDILATLNEMGINVVETEEAEADEEEVREKPESEETESGELVGVTPNTPAKFEAKEPVERTDDPLRMYLSEMRSIGLLSRQGEIAIAKRGASSTSCPGSTQAARCLASNIPAPPNCNTTSTTRQYRHAGGSASFNPSYYEEVLIVRVQREILRSEGIPGTPLRWRRSI